MRYSRKVHLRAGETSVPSAKEMVPEIVRLIDPVSVIDVGCGTGAWLSEFRARGVEDILGIDYDVSEEDLLFPREKFLRVDLTRPFSIPRRFDLAVCLEVAEHLPVVSAHGFIGSLVRLAPVVLFSAAIPYQGGTHHVNEQWPEYWEGLFGAHGYAAIDCLRTEFWTNPNVAWWYAQNTVVFVQRDRISNYPVLEACDTGRLVSLVHPLNYLSHADPARHGVRVLMWSLLSASARAVARRLSRPGHRR